MSESTRSRGPSRGARRRERATAAKAPAATPVTLTPRTWRLVELLVLATLAILALYAASQDVTGEDLWWHLATGRYILEHGEIPTRDVFSFTYPGAPWFNQEWLAQVLFFDLFRRGGGTALVAFKVLVAAALFPAAAWLGWRRSGWRCWQCCMRRVSGRRSFRRVREQPRELIGAWVETRRCLPNINNHRS